MLQASIFRDHGPVRSSDIANVIANAVVFIVVFISQSIALAERKSSGTDKRFLV